jgi:hypothetical protein
VRMWFGRSVYDHKSVSARTHELYSTPANYREDSTDVAWEVPATCF